MMNYCSFSIKNLFIMEKVMLKKIYGKSLTHKGLFLLVNLLLVIIYACEMIIPYMFSKFIDGVALSKSFTAARIPIIVISSVLIVLLIASYIKNICSEYLISKVNNDFLNDLDEKLELIPLKETKNENPAYLNQRLFNDIITAVTFAHENFSVAVITSISTLVLFVLIALTQKIMLVIVAVAVLINTIGILIYHKLMYKRGYEYREIHSLYYSSNNDRLSNIKETKIHSWYSISGEVVNSNFSKLLKKGIQLYKVMASITNVGTLSKNISLILTIALGGYLFTINKISIGQLILVTTYTNMCLTNTELFLKLGQEYQHAKVSYDRLKEFQDIPDEHNGDMMIDHINTIELNDLSFGYDESKPLYTSFNLKLERGKIYCLKGKNGEGKSTLLDLILGLNYDYDGAIFYNDTDIKSIDMRHARKRLVSTILQEPKMQRVSVRENLVRGLKDINEIHFDELVHIFDLNELLKGEDAQSLSGGEKQKVSVIRGLLKDSDLLILDEPVSAMDTDGINCLKEILLSLKPDKIILFISHNEELYEIVDDFIAINV